MQSLDIRRTVRLAYFELVAAASRVQVTTELRGFAERTRNAARDRFESGAAPRLEALQAELALAQADNEQEAARGRLDGRARIAQYAASAAAPDAAADPADAFDAGRIPAGSRRHRSRQAPTSSRSIARSTRRSRASGWRVAMRTPDPTVSGGVLFDAQPEFTYGWRAGVAVTIPVFTRHNADVQVETARVAQLRAQREARVADADRRGDRGRRRARAGRAPPVPPLSRRDHSAARDHRSRWPRTRTAPGRPASPAFLQALQAAREVRLRATDAGLEYQTALADLERALGGPVR